MKIGVTSQNFRTITAHAGKTRRFFIYEGDKNSEIHMIEKLDLPKEMSMHESDANQPHPIDDLDVLITAGCGNGFRKKMAKRGIELVVTGEPDPVTAVKGYLEGNSLPFASVAVNKIKH